MSNIPVNEQDKPQNPANKQTNHPQKQLIKQILNLEAHNTHMLQTIDNLKQDMRLLTHKILRKSPSTLATHKSKIQNQFLNICKSTQIKRKQLKKIKKQLTWQQKLQSIEDTTSEIRTKTQGLEKLRKQVKELEMLNRNLELKNRNLKRETKSLGKINTMKEALSYNRYFKNKVSEITEREKHVKERIKTQVNDNREAKSRLSTLPEIGNSRKNLSLKKQKEGMLEKEKIIITKWIGDHRMLVNQNLDTELGLIIKQNNKLTQKFSLKQNQVVELRKQIQKIRYCIPENQSNEKKKAPPPESPNRQAKTKDWGSGVVEQTRAIRKDWVGKFDSLRFSDARFIRQQCRLYSILHNDQGYYKFSYFSLKTGEIYQTSPPFNTVIAPSGQERVFEVVWPDYIKSIEVVIDTSIFRIAGMNVRSLSGIEGEFKDSVYEGKSFKKKSSKPQFQTYKLEIGDSEAPMCLFGSYHIHYDSNNKLTDVFLQGLGADIIEQIKILR